MPTIATFLGVSIKLYFNDHQPPHFHAFHSNDEAMIGINPVVVLEGSIAPARLKDVFNWAQRHQLDLVNRWECCQTHQPVPKVAYP